MKPKLTAPGTKRLKLKYDAPLSSFAFKFKLRRYIMDVNSAGAGVTKSAKAVNGVNGGWQTDGGGSGGSGGGGGGSATPQSSGGWMEGSIAAGVGQAPARAAAAAAQRPLQAVLLYSGREPGWGPGAYTRSQFSST
jgi:hypothetical protein